MHIIDGKVLAKKIELNLAKQIAQEKERPNLAVVLVGEDPASKLYVQIKERACRRVGIYSHTYLLEQNSSKEQIKEVIKFLNADEEIDAILVQLPLPKRSFENEIIASISPQKDVDGFHKKNLAKIKAGKPNIIPGLALGILALIKAPGLNLNKKKCAILCNTPLFALPLKFLLKKENVNVKVLPHTTAALSSQLKEMDIVIVALGKKNFITKEMLKDQAIVIDVGINKTTKGICGDVNVKSVKKKDIYLTPVPGGVGPMTVAYLLQNSYNLKYKKNDGA